MRIIAGSYRSRPLKAPPGLSTRPTSDRLRETLFNVLAPRIPGAAFLDLYAGSGAVGIEALSRGALHVTFVDHAPTAVKILRGNLERLAIGNGFHIHPGSVGAFLRSSAKANLKPERYEVVFLDPPYDEEREYTATLGLLGGSAAALLAPGAQVVAEHARELALDDQYGSLKRMRQLKQGDAVLSFYEAHSGPSHPSATSHPE
jgi:16S rRNA (guanine(966)-N(2))-methyltransferase RsmD